jgi:hypothetical protein
MNFAKILELKIINNWMICSQEDDNMRHNFIGLLQMNKNV